MNHTRLLCEYASNRVVTVWSVGVLRSVSFLENDGSPRGMGTIIFRPDDAGDFRRFRAVLKHLSMPSVGE